MAVPCARSRDIANFRAAVINCGFSGSLLMLKFPYCLYGVLPREDQ